MLSSETGGSRRRTEGSGFTLVELLVVMAIITFAAGLMTPAIAEYYRNRAVDSVKGEINGVFRHARLKAVTDGRDISIVFFREGPRVFDELNRVFDSTSWSQEDSVLSSREAGVWYELGCSGDSLASVDPRYDDSKFEPAKPFIPPFAWWEERQKRLRQRLRADGVQVHDLQFQIEGLAKVTFHRDGTMSFGLGLSDVRSAEFRQAIPKKTDIMVFQDGNQTACFIDIQPTGQPRSKLVLLDAPKGISTLSGPGEGEIPARRKG